MIALDSEKLYSQEEFGKLVNASRQAQHKWRLAGKLPFLRIGVRVFYSADHIRRFLARCERKEAA